MTQANSSQQPGNTPASNSPSLLSVLSFDGQDDCVDFGVQPHFKVQKHLTLELWVWIESQRQWAGIISKVFDTGSTESGYGLLLDGNSGVYFGVKVPRHQIEYLSSGTNTVPLKEWHHVAATYDGQHLRVYVGGVEKAIQTLVDSSIYYVPDNNLRLGMYRDNNEAYAFHGSIAEVRLWEIARTQAEIQGAMGRRLSGTETGLVGYWPLNEGIGKAIQDKTANRSQGAIAGATWQQVQRPLPYMSLQERNEATTSVALSFDGQDDYVAVAIENWETSTFSIELWIKAATTAQKNFSAFFNSWDGGTPGGSFQLDISNGSYRFLHNKLKLLLTEVREEWLHLAVTYDGSTLVTYVNGDIAKQQKKSLNICFKDYILGRNRSRNRHFKGELSEVRIWNRVRTQAEIRTDPARRLTGNEPGLVAYFPISEGVGNITNDQTANAKQGIISGASWITSSGLPIAAGTARQPDTTTSPDITNPSEAITAPETASPSEATTSPETTTSPDATSPPDITSPPTMTTQPNAPTSTSRWVLQFDGVDDYAELPPASIPSGNGITCSFWAYGGGTLPKNNSIVAAFDATGTRLLNIHLPWGDGCIYFDCGCSNGTYDRLNKQSNPAEFKGKWSHWAFTKNCATGEMKLYLNGALWHSVSGKTLPIPKAIRAQFGCYTAGSYHYQGMLAEVQFWNYARSQAEVQQSMNRALTGTEAGLVSYYPMQQGSSNTILNRVGNTHHGTMKGAIWISTTGLSIASVSVSPPSPMPLQPTPVTPITTSPAPLSILESRQSVLKLGQNHQGIAVGSGALPPHGRFTLEAWVCPSSLTGQQVLLADGEALFYLEGGNLKFRASAATDPIVSSNAGLSASKWYHVVVVRSGSQPGGTKLYLSGEQNDSQVAISVIASGGSTYLGGHPNLPDAKFKGYLTEVRVWRLARSLAEIKANMFYRLTGRELGLIRYWPLNGSVGNKIVDKTTYRVPGNLMGEITREEVDIPLKLKLEPQERLTRSTGLEDYGYWYREMAKQHKAKTEADPPFLRGRIWR